MACGVGLGVGSGLGVGDGDGDPTGFGLTPEDGEGFGDGDPPSPGLASGDGEIPGDGEIAGWGDVPGLGRGTTLGFGDGCVFPPPPPHPTVDESRIVPLSTISEGKKTFEKGRLVIDSLRLYSVRVILRVRARSLQNN